MPRTNAELPREEKLKKILDSAEELFRTRGYKATTMAAVAKAAGISPNAIYWYLPSKDHLLVAVLERYHEWVRNTLRAGTASRRGFREMVGEIIAACRQIWPLMEAAHERAPLSPVVAEYHSGFHTRQRGALASLVAPAASSKEEAQLLADAILFVVEGTLSHHRLGRPVDEVLQLAIRRLVRPEQPR